MFNTIKKTIGQRPPFTVRATRIVLHDKIKN